MGEVVAAALVSHVPPLVFPEEWRVMQGFGEDTDLINGIKNVRAEFDKVNPDTIIIVDSHWFTTIEHVMAGAEHHNGTLISEELPTLIPNLDYDYRGAPELGAVAEQVAGERSDERTLSGRPRVVSIADERLPHHYSTINVVKYLCTNNEKVLTTGVNQTARPHNFLEFGDILREAIGRTDCRVAVVGSGAMSHRFHSFDDLVTPHSLKYHQEGIVSQEAVEFDMAVLDLWKKGDHAAVLDQYSNYLEHFPEAWFGHYITMLGVLGGSDFKGAGTAVCRYENQLGTGNTNVVFEIDRAES